MNRRLTRVVLLLSCCLCVAAPARATTILYQAVDLPDAGGGDLWLYRYFVSDRAFEADQGFSVGFALGEYADLEDPPPAVGLDWDILALQPDAGIPDDGLYDALALVDSASLAQAFEISFVWLGAGEPGSQPFAVNQFDAGGGFVALLETGFTQPFVPEPGVAALAALGLALALARRR